MSKKLIICASCKHFSSKAMPCKHSGKLEPECTHPNSATANLVTGKDEYVSCDFARGRVDITFGLCGVEGKLYK